jgi:ferredoxin-type protein NapH
MKSKLLALGTFGLFLLIGLVLWFTQGSVFFVFNFGYIGGFVSLGIYLMSNKKPYARNIAEIGVGLYMFVLLGIIAGENMQLEGFFYFLFLGVFQAAVIHYAVAKIVGPFIFGRGWCGYACWTAAVLDLLPYKVPKSQRVKRYEYIRYIVFILSFSFVGALFIFKVEQLSAIMYWSFIIGNVIYYALGVILAYKFQDNRAFCKYFCPITVFLKPFSYFSLTRIKVDKEKCIDCGACRKVCPMNVDMLDNKRSRENGTECILCIECVNKCPVNALKL